MSIFNFFKKSVKPTYAVLEPTDVYFHEDLFCQVEFTPRENLLYLEEENKKIAKFSNEHFDGDGYTDIYIRKDDVVSIAAKKIHFEKIELFLKDIGFIKAHKVYYGYGGGHWICENTCAYTLHEAKIFVDFKEDTVTSFWLDNFRFHQQEYIKQDLKQALLKIGIEFNVVLNDWDQAITVDLTEGKNIEKYLNEEL